MGLKKTVKGTLIILSFINSLIFVYLNLNLIGNKRAEEEIKEGLEKEIKMELVAVYDNYQFDPGLKTGWGLSCMVKLKDKNILLIRERIVQSFFLIWRN